MNLSAVYSFEKRIDELKKEIKLQIAVGELVRIAHSKATDTVRIPSPFIEDLLEASPATRRRVQYSVVMTELYAAWEELVEGLLHTYLTEVSAGGGQLARDATAKHLAKSLEIINQSMRTNSRFADIDVATYLNNAVRVHGADYSSLNFEALVNHLANLRSAVVETMLSDVGAVKAWDGALADVDLRNALTREGFNPPNERRISMLDEVCDRRNDVAHGAKVDNFIDPVDQLRNVRVFSSLGRALGRSLEVAAFSKDSVHYVLAGHYEERFKNKGIYSVAILIPQLAIKVAVGDRCVVVDHGGTAVVRFIESIEINDERVTEHECLDTQIAVGLNFDNQIPKNATIHLDTRRAGLRVGR